MAKEYQKICIVCGKEYVAHNHKSSICSDKCRHKRGKEQEKQRKARVKIRNELERLKNVKGKTLTELAIEARQHGMTYGQYVAQLELQRQQIRKKH